MILSKDYFENTCRIRQRLYADENFDVIERRLTVSDGEMTFFFIDGFVKDGEMQRIMQTLLSEKNLKTARDVLAKLPYVEVDLVHTEEEVTRGILSGQSALLSEGFGDGCIMIDARTYPARPTQEPDTDRVMQGAHDGFVETLVTNTTLIRRRIRDERLAMKHFSMGGSSKTDVVMCYMRELADEKLVNAVKKKLKNAAPKSITLGFQSLAETLIKHGWFNPFPKIRTTERPDTAAAQLLEGSIIVLCDTSPQAMILPTSIFDYIQETDDFYYPPLTGTYLRLVRIFILLLSVVLTPLWYLCLEYSALLPEPLLFIVPKDTGALPVILQLLLVEVAIDGLKIASMNTPDMLSNSLSVVGALILGDYAVDAGWLCGEVILYMAFVAIANFAQQNHELGYAFKFVRVMLLVLVFFFKVYGLLLGIIISVILVVTNKTLLGRRYLYPVIPFNAKAFLRLVFRSKKHDFYSKNS